MKPSVTSDEPPDLTGWGIRPVTDKRPRCWRCNKLFAYYLSRPWKLLCPRCRAPNSNEHFETGV